MCFHRKGLVRTLIITLIHEKGIETNNFWFSSLLDWRFDIRNLPADITGGEVTFLREMQPIDRRLDDLFYHIGIGHACGLGRENQRGLLGVGVH